MFAKNSARLGFSTWLWWRIFNSTITFIPILGFSYTVLYLLLPKFFFHKKNRAVAGILYTGILILILLAHYFGAWLISWNNARLNSAKVIGNDRISHSAKIILFNYPIVAGFAVILKMMKRSWLKQQETYHVAKEKTTAELQLLKAQIHPHFLFNTLNNIYFFTLTSPQKAPEMLIKLSDILRYIIDECNQPLVPLAKELKMIEDYMALEKMRYGERLRMQLEINGHYERQMIVPLILIPLVENSFKHGASKMLTTPSVNLNIKIEGQFLYFLLSNAKPDELILPQLNGRIGLTNVRKRLQLLYPSSHELNIAESKNSFEVFLKIKLAENDNVLVDREIKTESNQYAVA